MKHLLLTILIAATSLQSFAQNNQKPCTAPEAAQFDFWVGSWDLYSADTITGTNTIYKIMDGCAVQENFESQKMRYSGKSWSMYDPQLKLWQQTWIDNQGGFIYLSGKFENGTMTLTTEARKMPNGKEQTYRMVYHNISKDSFDWDWESTTDNGTTWINGWHIHYKRK
ncbi:MAG: DUF1579 family protein [Ferruginibacter sp.]